MVAVFGSTDGSLWYQSQSRLWSRAWLHCCIFCLLKPFRLLRGTLNTLLWSLLIPLSNGPSNFLFCFLMIGYIYQHLFVGLSWVRLALPPCSCSFTHILCVGSLWIDFLVLLTTASQVPNDPSREVWVKMTMAHLHLHPMFHDLVWTIDYHEHETPVWCNAWRRKW